MSGYYQCHSDGLLYQVLQAPKAHGGGLQLRRRRADEPEWRPAVPTTKEHITRLLRFGSLTKLEQEP